MTVQLFNRIRFRTPTTGTGTIAVGAPTPPSSCVPSEAGVQDADTVRYLIEDGSTAFEIGTGTYSASGDTLSRDTVLLSKIGGGIAGTDKLNLSGNAIVTFTPAAEDLPGPQGAQGPQGDTGPQGEQGPQGIQGETGPSGGSLPPLATVWSGDYTQSVTLNDSSSGTKTANTAAIQAVIDEAYANGWQTIHLPAGQIWCDPGIYLDAPENLRSDESTPTKFAFSMHLRGAGGLGNSENHGTTLLFTDRTEPAVIVGTGQGMRVSDLSVRCSLNEATSRAALPSGGVGIALAGGSGGLSRALIDNVGVSHFREGIKTGYNADQLCDSVTLIKVNVNGCYRGINFHQSQNYINSLYDCTFGANTYHVYSTATKPINVYGGNYSTASGLRKVFAISSVSALTEFTDTIPGGTITNWSFTATLTSPDQPMADGAYDAFAIETASFGVIPLTLTDYSAGVATFELYAGWVSSHVNFSLSLKDDTDLEAELQAAESLHACETAVMFYGAINVDGVHIENNALTLLYDQDGNNTTAALRKLDLQYQISHYQYASSDDDNRAVFVCQQVFPFIRRQAGSPLYLTIDDVQFGSGNASNTNGDSILIEANRNQGAISVRNAGEFRNPNLYIRNGTAIHFQDDVQDFTGSMAVGFGDYDETPFVPRSSSVNNYRRGHIHYVPFVGFAPAPHAVPQLVKPHFDRLVNGTSATLNPPPPPIYGGILYSIADRRYASPQANLLLKSGHQFWSYGEDLSIDWTYKGQSNALYVTDTSKLFHGLKIILDNGTDDETAYVVTGVYPSLGYVTVINLNGGRLVGDKDTTFTGDTIKQEAYDFGVIGTVPAVKSAADDTSGAATAAAGDMTGAARVNLTLSAVGAANYTTRTATQMFGDIVGCYAGYTYELAIRNTSAGTTTLVGGTDVTVSGTATIAAGVTRIYEVTFPTATTCTITNLGALS